MVLNTVAVLCYKFNEFSDDPVHIEVQKKNILVLQDGVKQFFLNTFYISDGICWIILLFLRYLGDENILLLYVCIYISVLKGRRKHIMRFKVYMPTRTQIWIFS